jgi:hypothetical protein
LGQVRAGRAVPVRLTPVTKSEARRFVGEHHRHNKPHTVSICQIGLEHDGELLGVAVVERPNAHALCDGFTVEITRLCVLDGAPKNACSVLYGAACRAAKALGYRRAVTYTLTTEDGASVKAAGFELVGKPTSKEWQANKRERQQSMPWRGTMKGKAPRVRWERAL